VTTTGMDLTARALEDRARQIAVLTQAGHSARQIAERLQVSARTVTRYRSRRRNWPEVGR
jgi:DNA-binding NarL/FixJ family response regulator